MLQVRCIKKHKDKNGRIIGYTLVDSNNKTADVYAEVLKEKIKNKLVEVTNLTLTSDNRLIDASEKETTVKK